MVKKSVSSPTENKENTSPGSCRSPGNLDLDFPMLLSNVGEESREQHNMKERKRRYKHKGVLVLIVNSQQKGQISIFDIFHYLVEP